MKIDVSKAQKLQTMMSEINKLETIAKNSYFELGKRWEVINKEKLWKHSGSPVKTFRQFCEKETPYSHTQVYNMINVFLRFDAYKDTVDTIPDMTRLVKVLPFLPAGQEEEWYHKAAHLPKEGFESAVAEHQNRTPKDACEHNGETEQYWRCCVCSKFFKQ
mgnify:CR=1 FL=1